MVVDHGPHAVLVLTASALDDGPHVDINVNTEWWATAHKDHRKAVFVGAVQSLGELGNRVIPEEFNKDALRPLEPIGDPPNYEDLYQLMKQARAWARALDVIHTKTFIGPGPHPDLEAFQAQEQALRDAALKL